MKANILGMGGVSPLESILVQLKTYRAALAPADSEIAMVDRVLAFIECHPDALSRTCLAGHVTGSAFILDPGHTSVLFVHHAKLDKWLQPGGHCEEGEDAFAAALRETREETGLVATPLDAGHLFDVDVHPIPARPAIGTAGGTAGGVPAHFHYDLRFLFEARPGRETKSEESHAIEWLSFAEAARRDGEASITRPLAKIGRYLARDAHAAEGE